MRVALRRKEVCTVWSPALLHPQAAMDRNHEHALIHGLSRRKKRRRRPQHAPRLADARDSVQVREGQHRQAMNDALRWKDGERSRQRCGHSIELFRRGVVSAGDRDCEGVKHRRVFRGQVVNAGGIQQL